MLMQMEVRRPAHAVDVVPTLRRATAADGPALAELVNFGNEGLPLHIWRSLVRPGQDPWAFGAQLEARRAEAGETIVMEGARGVVAAMCACEVPAEPRPEAAALHPMLAPLDELEALVPSTLLVSALSVFPRARGKGVGARLVRHAEALAEEAGLRGVAILVADQNEYARRLYHRLGYLERDRRPMVVDGWDTASRDWILLGKLRDD